ncbi:uncharacterized protein PG998_013016 [Apiospora kogelbergensis]|uniref:uncharacterized protein n=1 Tax=Apiospora kogelbergensis TaxID=1337665 RepID=UPI0031305477
MACNEDQHSPWAMFSRWMLDFKGEVLQHRVSGMFPILRAVIDKKVDRYPTSKSAHKSARKAARKARKASFKAGPDMPSSVADAPVPSPVHSAAPSLDGDATDHDLVEKVQRSSSDSSPQDPPDNPPLNPRCRVVSVAHKQAGSNKKPFKRAAFKSPFLPASSGDEAPFVRKSDQKPPAVKPAAPEVPVVNKPAAPETPVVNKPLVNRPPAPEVPAPETSQAPRITAGYVSVGVQSSPRNLPGILKNALPNASVASSSMPGVQFDEQSDEDHHVIWKKKKEKHELNITHIITRFASKYSTDTKDFLRDYLRLQAPVNKRLSLALDGFIQYDSLISEKSLHHR